MLDLNHIFLFVASAAPIFLLARGWRRGGLTHAWRLAAVVVLIVTGVSWMVQPETAGFVGGGAWVALLYLPAIGLRRASELVLQQRYTSARRLVGVLRFLHPSADVRAQAGLLRGMEVAQQGDFVAALKILGSMHDLGTSAGRQAIAQSYRIRADWTGLLRWLRTELPPSVAQIDLALFPLYLRALGETGARDELVAEFTAQARTLGTAPQHLWFYDASLLVVLAFGGRFEVLAELFQTKFHELSGDIREFWLGTAQLAAGETKSGRARLENLHTTTGDALIRLETTRRLEHSREIGQYLFLPATDEMLRRIKPIDQTSQRLFGGDGPRFTPAVVILIALNLAMFFAEWFLGGTTDPITLYRLGALDLVAVLAEGEYWRLLTSLFLHYGPLHLLFNLYALFVIGPGLEEAIGSVRFGICYLLSGLGSSVGVVLLFLVGWNRAELLVGASGCVMGLVGVWAGLLLRHRDAPLAALRLKNILVIVAIQTAFDLATPQISMAAHLSGLVSGAILGLMMSSRKLPA